MTKYTTPPLKSHQLSLFDWRAVVVHQPLTVGGRFVRNRFPVRPELADLIAALAGLGSAVER
jgi:hypothetical protein